MRTFILSKNLTHMLLLQSTRSTAVLRENFGKSALIQEEDDDEQSSVPSD